MSIGERAYRLPLLGLILAVIAALPALRSLASRTELVLYPDHRHAIMTPSYRAGRLERYLELVRELPPARQDRRGAPLRQPD